MRLLEQAVQENEVAYPAIDTQRLLSWIVSTKRDGEILVADVGNGRIVGVLGLLAQEYKWSSEKFIQNEFAFVLPAFRPRGTFDALMQASYRFADEKGLRIIFGFSGGRDSKVKDRMMQMKGWIYCGGMFTRLAQHSSQTG